LQFNEIETNNEVSFVEIKLHSWQFTDEKTWTKLRIC